MYIFIIKWFSLSSVVMKMNEYHEYNTNVIFTARRSVASRAGIVIAHGTGGRVGANKNVPLDAGSPKLAQRFVSTPSSILPEMMSLSTSGRLQFAIL